MNYLATIFVLFLITLTQNVAAENWIKTVVSEDRDTTVYVDTETIKKHEGFVYYWSLDDYTEPLEANNALSVKVRNKADCNLDREQSLAMIFYSGNMGKGEADIFTPPKEWRYPIPGSVGKISFDFACTYSN